MNFSSGRRAPRVISFCLTCLHACRIISANPPNSVGEAHGSASCGRGFKLHGGCFLLFEHMLIMPAKDLVSQSRSLFGALRVAGWAPFLLLSSSCFPFCSLSSSFCLLPLCSLFCFFFFLALLLYSRFLSHFTFFFLSYCVLSFRCSFVWSFFPFPPFGTSPVPSPHYLPNTC